jgi:hypothetical protein
MLLIFSTNLVKYQHANHSDKYLGTAGVEYIFLITYEISTRKRYIKQATGFELHKPRGKGLRYKP